MKTVFKNICTALTAIMALLFIMPENGFSWDSAPHNKIEWGYDFQQAQELSKKTGKPILAHFYSGYCNPCMMMETYVFPNPTIIETVQKSFIPVKINVDQNQAIKEKYNINSVPFDLVLTSNDQIIHFARGGQNVNGYWQFLMIAQTKAKAFQMNPPSAAPPKPQQIPNNVKIEPGGACPIEETPSFDYASIPAEDKARIEFEGYCPVELERRLLWVRGDYNNRYLFEGRLYLFSGKEQMEEFKRHPEKYAPAFQGFDIVTWKDRGERVHGFRYFGARAGGRVFLFSSEENLIKFEKNTRYYLTPNNRQ